MTAKPIVSAVSESVAGSRWPISVITGVSEKIEMPKLPCRRCQNQRTNCTLSGSASPSCRRIAMISAGVALFPAMIAAGSPGAMCRRRKTKTPTRTITRAVESRRRTM
jgi:hypothetical protein